MGRGRHAMWLAAHGYRVFGVEINQEAVRAAVESAPGVRAWCADLTSYSLPADVFDLVVVSRYLDRDRFPEIARAVRRGGVLLYETFTEAQLRRGRGPTSPGHLLRSAELAALLRAAAPFELLYYEEVFEPDALARLAARRS